jgi:endo-1,4-beta-xylanase
MSRASFRRQGVHKLRSIRLLIVVLASSIGFVQMLSAQVVASYTFNDGTADGWTSFNGASTPVASSAETYNGSAYSLLTTTGSSGQGGPSISLNTVLQAGAQYTVTGYVMLTSGESATNANFTMKRSDPSCSGGTCYDTIGNYEVPVNSTSWTQIGGSYTVSETETGLTLYAQLVGATTAQSFYLADVVITEIAPPPGGTPVATYTYSDGGLDGWAPFGPVTLTNETLPVAPPNNETLGLLTTGRTATYMGPSLNLLSISSVVAGATYQVTAYVLLAEPDSSGPTATLSLKTTNCASSSGVYNNFGTSGALSNTAWTKIQGTFSFSDLPGPPTSLTLYIQSSSATDSFYIADVVISEVQAPPVPVSQQNNAGITTTFEDGGLDGWSSRSGQSVLTNVASPGTPPNGDTNSLYITDRIANYDGPQISVSDVMYVGSVYDISVWVMTPTVDSSSHVFNISLQTTLNGNVSYPSVSSYPGVTVPDDGNWHQISVMNYTMSSAYTPGEAYLYLQTVPASGNDLTSFYMTDFQLTYVPPPTIQTNIPSIYKTLAEFFPIGAAVDTTDLSGPHAQLLTKHFNSMTPENDLKWSVVEPSLGIYDYTNGDAEVGEAVCADMKVRGQNLVWATGEQTPSYAFGDGSDSAANQATVTANIQEHIQSEVQHYGTEVYAWDVVNEPLDPTQADCLYHGPFYQVLGPQYINIAFEAAKQYAPPGTKLFLNDYSLNDPNRLACLVKVVHQLLAEGVPISGIGNEEHNDINYPSIQLMANSIETVHSNFPRLDQQVTELDESVYNAGDATSNYGNNVPLSVLAEQGWLYKDYFDLFRRLHSDLTAVTFWGMADDDTWLDATRTDYPLPFSTTLQAKPAYWGIVDPRKLPGYGLSFSLSTQKQVNKTQVWTITARNGDVGPAYATELSSFSLVQLAGAPCSPAVTAPSSYPILLGDIPVSGTASVSFTVNFSACSPFARFAVNVPWSSAVYHTGTFVEFPHD